MALTGMGRYTATIRVTLAGAMLLSIGMSRLALAQDDSIAPECAQPYADRYQAWMTYFANPSIGQPAAPDPQDPCFAALTKAQADAITALVAATPIPTAAPTPAGDQAPPATIEVPVSSGGDAALGGDASAPAITPTLPPLPTTTPPTAN